MSKEKRNAGQNGGGMYRGISIPVKVLDWVILIGAAVLVGIFIFALSG